MEILLLYVKTGYVVPPLKSGCISESDLCVPCGVCQNYSGSIWRELSYMIDGTSGYNTGKDKESCEKVTTVTQTRISNVMLGK